jgi:hypothetical protein
MDTPRVFFKEFDNTLAALLVSRLDVASNSVWRWNFEVGVPSREEVNEFGIRDDGRRAIAFRYPLCNVGSNI